MADFSKTAEIISRCMGYKNNEFIDAFNKNIKIQVQEAIAANPIGTTLVRLMEVRSDDWKGTATELLGELEPVATDLKINTSHKSWPKSPSILSRRLNEVKTNLREVGIIIDNGSRGSTVRAINIRKVSSLPSLPSHDGNRAQSTSDNHDGTLRNDVIVGSTDEVPSQKDSQNRAQNRVYDDSDDSDGTLYTLHGPSHDHDYPSNCYYCDYKPDSKDHYERHVILRHDHCLAYPNYAEIEKRQLKKQGKEWEK
jgi:hypothetical protein